MEITPLDNVGFVCCRCGYIQAFNFITCRGSSRVTVSCGQCGTSSKHPTHMEKLLRFYDRLPAAAEKMHNDGFELIDWVMSKDIGCWQLDPVQIKHSCGHAFNLKRMQIENLADSPASLRCPKCRKGAKVGVAKEFLVCFRHINRSLQRVSFSFVPGLFGDDEQLRSLSRAFSPSGQESEPK